jgi:hypothetical protein
MTQAHQVAKKKANQVVLTHARPREQSGAFEKFKLTATASHGQGQASGLKMGIGFMTSIFLKPI